MIYHVEVNVNRKPNKWNKRLTDDLKVKGYEPCEENVITFKLKADSPEDAVKYIRSMVSISAEECDEDGNLLDSAPYYSEVNL